jgi:ubiquitin-conjugating enzyme E2 W
MLRKGIPVLFAILLSGMVQGKLPIPISYCSSLPTITNMDPVKYDTFTGICPENTIVQILALPRGGSLITDDTDDSLLVKKLRNVIRSVLRLSEKKAPILGKIIKLFWGKVENLTGVELLPKQKKSKKDKKVQLTQRRKEKREKKRISKKNDPKGKARSDSAQQHLSKDLKATNPNYRIQRELKEFMRAPPPNLKVKVGKNIRIWIITMKGAKNTIYESETYRLRVQFPADYPTVPPSVYFLQPTPRHEHVYTNGDICLSLLGKDWRPTMTGQSIAVSILSILSGAQRKSLPMDNAAHAQHKPGEKQDDWVYHDDNC